MWITISWKAWWRFLLLCLALKETQALQTTARTAARMPWSTAHWKEAMQHRKDVTHRSMSLKRPTPSAVANILHLRQSQRSMQDKVVSIGGTKTMRRAQGGRKPQAAFGRGGHTTVPADQAQPYLDKPHAQEHFLSVLKDVKQPIDAFHNVSAHDPAFGQRWASCAIVRAPCCSVLTRQAATTARQLGLASHPSFI